MNKKVTELTEATEINDDDLFMIVQNGENKNVKNSIVTKKLKDKIKELEGIILYEDETGTTGNVTLSEDATNYEDIEVFGYRADRALHIKVETVRKYFQLSHIRFVEPWAYFYTKEYLINGNMLNAEYSKRISANASGIGEVSDDVNIYITKVVGHNKKI